MDDRVIIGGLEEIMNKWVKAELEEVAKHPPVFFQLNKDRTAGNPTFNIGRSTK